MKIYVSNAFSLSMLDREQQGADTRFGTIMSRGIRFPRVPRPIADPKEFIAASCEHGAEVISILGHAATRGILETALGIDCPVNRQSIKLEPGEHVLVGQYIGPRLPEGATELPEGSTIEWWLV